MKDLLLKGDEWEAINKKAGVDVLDIVVNLDNRYTPNRQAELIAERCNLTAKAQLAKDQKHYAELMEKEYERARKDERERIEGEFIWGQVLYHDLESGTIKEWTMRCISDKDWQSLKEK